MRMVKMLTVEPMQDDVGDDELRLLGRITAGVAHDFNNYMSAITTLIALIEASPNDTRLLATARMGIDQARRLAGSLVSYVRGESPAFETVDFGALVHRTLAVVQRSISPALLVHADIAPDLPSVRGAASELEQLVLNLVLNAADAMPRGGVITVRVQPTGAAMVSVEVSDTGSGLPAEVLVTSDGRTASTKPGQRAGLGLGIARRVIAHHRGCFKLMPRTDRAGTIVSAVLPTS
jgi:signal transduction histidine kinase